MKAMAPFEQITIRQLKELADQFKKNVDGYVEEVSQSILKGWESSPKDRDEALRFLKQPMPIVGGVPVAEGAEPAFDSEAAVKKLEDKVKKQSNQIKQQGQDIMALKDHAEEQALKNALALKVCSDHLRKVGTLVKDLAQPQGKKFGAATSQIQPQIAKGESDVTQKQGAEGEADEGAKCQTTDAKAGNLQALALPPKSARLMHTIERGGVKNTLCLEGGLILFVIEGRELIVIGDKENQPMNYMESKLRDVAVLHGHEVALFKSEKQPWPLDDIYAMVILSVTKDYIQEKAVYDLGCRNYQQVTTLDCKTLAALGGREISVLDHTGNILQRIGLNFAPRSVCKSPDGNLLTTDGTMIYKYDRQTGSQLLRLQMRNVSKPGAFFSLPCGSTLVMDMGRRTFCLLGQDLLWKADIWTAPTDEKGSLQRLFVMGDNCSFITDKNLYFLELDH